MTGKRRGKTTYDKKVIRGDDMLDERYYEGFEGEGQVTIWCDEDGMVIWSGYFETILEGCWRSDFSHDGIVKCYHNRDGFFDGVWEMQYPHIVLDELDKFDEKLLNTDSKGMIEKSKEVISQLVSFINGAIENKRRIYVEYD